MVALPAATPPEPLPALPPIADLPALRARVAHIRRFDDISTEHVTALVSGQTGLTRVRRQLLHVGEGLDWSGTLADIDRWPADPVIRDMRWRLAGDRAVVGVRGALTEDWEEIADVVPDVERLAMEPVAIATWPTANGWADNERRFALRHHAGRLRILEEMLRRGLFMLPIRNATADRWQAGVARRRQECVDALVGLRLAGRLQWIGEPPAWDQLFRTWFSYISDLSPSAVPPGPRMLLRGAVDEVAAVAAGTCWLASATGARTQQSFVRAIPLPETIVDVVALPHGAAEPLTRAEGSVTIAASATAVRLSWTGFGEDGAASLPVPGRIL